MSRWQVIEPAFKDTTMDVHTVALLKEMLTIGLRVTFTDVVGKDYLGLAKSRRREGARSGSRRASYDIFAGKVLSIPWDRV
jgi:hypothetical protein